VSLHSLARTQALAILASPFVSNDDIERLKSHLVHGQLDGKDCESCFFGILGGGTHSGYDKLRRDMSMEKDNWHAYDNPIEDFCEPIKYGNTPKNNERVRMLMSWADLELARRKYIERKFVGESTCEPISVTEEMIVEREIGVVADNLIAETAMDSVTV
jgi:hypothetical protein